MRNVSVASVRFSYFLFFLFCFFVFTPGHLAEVAMVIGGWCRGVHPNSTGGRTTMVWL